MKDSLIIKESFFVDAHWLLEYKIQRSSGKPVESKFNPDQSGKVQNLKVKLWMLLSLLPNTDYGILITPLCSLPHAPCHKYLLSIPNIYD
jgi:hypothetical protein